VTEGQRLDRGGGDLPCVGWRAKAPESGRIVAGEGSEEERMTLGLGRTRELRV
jgi:hypothetical protein